jgi:hypothetical protein
MGIMLNENRVSKADENNHLFFFLENILAGGIWK